MGILTRFNNDILISYARVDDEPVGGGKGAGWITKFTQRLDKHLWRYNGSEASIWRDYDLKAAEDFNFEIERQLEQTGIVLALLSKIYVKSEYCQKELKWFDAAVRRSALSRAGSQNRIFPVLLYHLPYNEWPEPCEGLTGHLFHDSVADELGDPLNQRSGAFARSMKKLCRELLEALRALEQASRPAPSPEEATPSRGKVFLGFAADDRRSVRKRIAKALVEAGYHVLDPIPPPDERVEHKASVIRALEQADLAVHLLGEYAGRPFRDDEPEKTYVLEQVRLGLEGTTSQLILLPDQIDPPEMDEPFYCDFLQELEGLNRTRGSLEVARLSKAQMADVIMGRLEELAEARQPVPGALSADVAFVDIHVEDLPNATPLFGYLSDRQITPITMPTAGNDPSAGLDYFRKTLKHANMYIAVYGDVAPDWVKQRALAARKLMAEEHRQMKMAVFLASHHGPAAQADFSSAYAMLDGSKGIDPVVFDRFLLAPATATA